MKKRLTKAQLLAQAKQMQIQKKAAIEAPFTGMITLMNYTLWKDKGWGQSKLTQFNMLLNDYIDNPSPEEWLHNRLKENGVDDVHTIDLRATDVKNTGNRFLDKMSVIQLKYDNLINENCMKILLNAFNVLLDMGLKPYKVNQISDDINKRMGMLYGESGVSVMDWHRELIDEVGIYVDMPKKEMRKNYIPEDAEVEIV